MSEKKYLIIWTYSANYGTDIMNGTSKEDVLSRHSFRNRNDIQLVITELDNALIHHANEDTENALKRVN